MPAWPEENYVGVIESLGINGLSYDFIFTNQRIIGVVVAFAGGGSSLTGAAIGALLNYGEDQARQSYRGQKFDTILTSDRRNLQIPFSVIQKARLHGGTSGLTLPRLTLWGQNGKFEYEFFKQNWGKNSQVLLNAKAVLEATLGERLICEKL